MRKNCKAVSVWDNGVIVKIKATLHDDGFFESELVEVEGVNSLEDEYLEWDSGERLRICQECHEGVEKTISEEVVGKTLVEIKVCSLCGESM